MYVLDFSLNDSIHACYFFIFKCHNRISQVKTLDFSLLMLCRTSPVIYLNIFAAYSLQQPMHRPALHFTLSDMPLDLDVHQNT